MTNTVTILADHKGFARPRVLGDEYVVLGQCAITSFRTGTTASGTITANAVDVANNYTDTNGASTAFSGFVAGDHFVVAGSHSNNNALIARVVSVDGAVLNASFVDDDDTGGGNEVFTHAGEKILASSFGLSTINTVEIVGQEHLDKTYTMGALSADKTFFYLYALTTGSAATASASLPSGDIGTVDLRVTGLI